jgi:hypothetical protein
MINRCETILYLENGEIIEDDSYDNLLANQKSKFHGLYIDIITPKKSNQYDFIFYFFIFKKILFLFENIIYLNLKKKNIFFIFFNFYKIFLQNDILGSYLNLC